MCKTWSAVHQISLLAVLNSHCQARKAARGSILLTLGEHVPRLSKQAKVHNNANKCSLSSCCPAAAVQDCIEDEKEFETNVHDCAAAADHDQELDKILEAIMTAQHDQRSECCTANVSKGPGNQKHQANQMQGCASVVWIDLLGSR